MVTLWIITNFSSSRLDRDNPLRKGSMSGSDPDIDERSFAVFYDDIDYPHAEQRALTFQTAAQCGGIVAVDCHRPQPSGEISIV